MHITCRTLWLPKDGNTKEEYEDAAAPTESIDDDFEVFRCAVADGATETSFSGLWAKLLVDGYLAEQEPAELRPLWQAQLPAAELPWYAEQKASKGAFAALAGLTIVADGNWEAQAVGDSCVLQTRSSEIITAFPLHSPEQFNSRPALICSKTDSATDVPPENHSGVWQAGDKFLLLTDAIARWLLAAEVEKQKGIEKLWQLENEDDFRTFVQTERAQLNTDGRPKLLNDDLTLMLLEIN